MALKLSNKSKGRGIDAPNFDAVIWQRYRNYRGVNIRLAEKK